MPGDSKFSAKTMPTVGQWYTHATTGMLDRLRGMGNLLLPPHCVFCAAELPDEGSFLPSLCAACRRQFTSSDLIMCRRCAAPLPRHWGIEDRCPRCHDRSYHFSQAVALGPYTEAWRDAVLRLKHARSISLAHPLGDLMAERLLAADLAETVDAVIPVPMHWWRRFRRGIHTSRILAARVARRLDRPLLAKVIRCRHRTQKQGTLTIQQRFQNVRGAYQAAAGYHIADKHILVVDDVMTTGATLSQIALVLKRAGAAQVTGAVIARGTGH